MSRTTQQVRDALLAAELRSDATLDSHIRALWDASSDPTAARALLARLRAERDAAMTQLLASTDQQWWQTATPDSIGLVYEGAHLWSRADTECAELEKMFLLRLRERHAIEV